MIDEIELAQTPDVSFDRATLSFRDEQATRRGVPISLQTTEVIMKAFALVLALTVLSLPAQAASRNQPVRGAQIACTQYGCIPVPRGCYRESGRTWDGSPSGFDVVTCGSSTMYGHR